MIKRGITPYLVGTNADAGQINKILALEPLAQTLLGKTSFAGLAHLCANAAFVIGNDTGPTFMAARTGAPTIMLMGPQTDPKMSAPIGTAASWMHNANLQAITSDDVLAKLEDINVL